jgi:hypothetical protein
VCNQPQVFGGGKRAVPIKGYWMKNGKYVTMPGSTNLEREKRDANVLESWLLYYPLLTFDFVELGSSTIANCCLG